MLVLPLLDTKQPRQIVSVLFLDRFLYSFNYFLSPATTATAASPPVGDADAPPEVDAAAADDAMVMLIIFVKQDICCCQTR